jgi:N-acetylmuramoyl-L-alanine amidase
MPPHEPLSGLRRAVRALTLACLAALPAAASPAGGPIRIVIDPGHGGSDPGAVGNGLQEKDINLDVALRLASLLEADTNDPAGGGSWDVRLTRETDIDVSLQARVQLANAWPADRFYSIHHNAFGSPAANGIETYSFSNGTTAADLRDRSQEELVAALGLTDRGSKTANFYVLVNTTMPAILSEGGFITSPTDAAVLGNPAQRQRAAEAHLFALQRHHGLAPYLPNIQPTVYCQPKLTSAGCFPTIGAIGLASISTGVTLECQNVIGGVFGLAFWGTAPADAPFLGGRLCVAGPQTRTAPRYSGAPVGQNCQGILQTTLTPAYLAANGLAAGQTLYAQWWFRDPYQATNPVGLSAGLRFLLLP